MKKREDLGRKMMAHGRSHGIVGLLALLLSERLGVDEERSEEGDSRGCTDEEEVLMVW